MTANLMLLVRAKHGGAKKLVQSNEFFYFFAFISSLFTKCPMTLYCLTAGQYHFDHNLMFPLVFIKLQSEFIVKSDSVKQRQVFVRYSSNYTDILISW